MINGESMAKDSDKMSNQRVEIASDYPVFITTIYPLLYLDRDSVEYLKPIEDGYSPWGTFIRVAGRADYSIFASPLSYPYQFSKDGKNSIIKKLKDNPSVDPSSVSIKTFPNIPRSEQRKYGSSISNNLLIEEEYISFKISNWPNMNFMRFPTFTTMLFDYTKEKIRTPEDFKKITLDWRERINQFSQMEDLREILGIVSKTKRSHEIPILAFVSFRFLYEEQKIYNRYFGGGDAREKRNLFKNEISLFPISSNIDTVFKGRNFLFHEYNPVLRWRVYYSQVPLFYEGDWRLSVYPGGPSFVPGKLSQILRVMLFTHVVMPSFAGHCKSISETLEKHLANLQAERLRFFNEFSFRKLNDFDKKLEAKFENKQKIVNDVDRIEELLEGYDSLLQFFRVPFEIRRPDDFSTLRPPYDEQNKDNLIEFELEFFHFQKTARNHEDRRKCYRNVRIIRDRLDQIRKNLSRLHEEISNASVLLENRRNLIENKKNTLLAIGLPALFAFLAALFLWLRWVYGIRWHW